MRVTVNELFSQNVGDKNSMRPKVLKGHLCLKICLLTLFQFSCFLFYVFVALLKHFWPRNSIYLPLLLLQMHPITWVSPHVSRVSQLCRLKMKSQVNRVVIQVSLCTQKTFFCHFNTFFPVLLPAINLMKALKKILQAPEWCPDFRAIRLTNQWTGLISESMSFVDQAHQTGRKSLNLQKNNDMLHPHPQIHWGRWPSQTC